MKSGLFITLTLAALLAGCSIAAAPPAASSLDGLLGKTANRSTLTRIPTGNQVRVGVIYSETTQTNRAWLRNYQANAGTGFGQSLLVTSIHDAYVATSDPDQAVDWVRASLQRYFGPVTVYAEIHDLKAAKPDVTVVIDSRSQLITAHSSDIESTVSAHFYDKNLDYIATANGRDALTLTPVWADNKRSGEIVADINQQQNVQITALKKFDRSLSALLAGPGGRVADENNFISINHLNTDGT